MTRWNALPLLAGALLTAGAVLHAASPPTAESSQEYPYSAAAVIPNGSYVVDAHGLIRTSWQNEQTGGASEAAALPVLEAGTYLLASPRPRAGGAHLPTASAISIGGGTIDQTLRPDLSPMVVFATLWILLVALASLTSRRRLQIVLTGLAVCSLVAYSATGSFHVGPLGWLASLSFVAAALLAVALSGLMPRTHQVRGHSAPSDTQVGGRAASKGGWLLVSASSAILALGPATPLPFFIAAAIGLVASSLPGDGSRRRKAEQVAILASGLVAAAFLIPSFSASVQSHDTSADSCSTPETDESDECWAAYIVSQAGESPQDAVDQIAALEERFPELPRGPLCRKAGALLGMHFARDTPDPHALFTAAASPCDFSFVHGVPMGALLAGSGEAAADLPPSSAIDIASRVCREPGPAYLQDQTFTVQCWHGVGQGYARQTNLDIERTAAVCLGAPNRGARSNCAEGLFLELLEDSRRGRVAPEYQHAPSDTLERACQEFPEELILGCWRYWVVNAKESGVAAYEVAQRLGGECAGPIWRQIACWEGVGEALTGDGPGLDAGQRLAAGVALCNNAPQEELRLNCMQRSINNVIPVEGTDRDILALCAEIEPDLREQVCAEAFRFHDFIAGKDGKQV